MVAMDNGTDLVYFANDHLSSASLVMDASGTLLSENRYMPFGEVRDISGATNITETDFGYTGQRNLASMGLMDYNARFYSPTLGRFIQPDSFVPNPINPQLWNRYSYAYNNPIIYIDPDGNFAFIPLLIASAIIVTGWLVFAPPAYAPSADEAKVEAQKEQAESLPQTKIARWIDDHPLEYVAIVTFSVHLGYEAVGTLLEWLESQNEPQDDEIDLPVNDRDEPYPQVPDPRNPGENVPFPDDAEYIPDEEDRVPRSSNYKDKYQKWWEEDQGNPVPDGGWDDYKIHHEKPLSHGGNNDVENLVHLRDPDHNRFTQWWRWYQRNQWNQ